MSQSYREDCNDAKAVRQGVVEPSPMRSRSKKDRPIVIEQRYLPNPKMPIFLNWSAWHKFGSYRTQAEADKAIALHHHKHPGWCEFRNKAPLL